jgi:hypothetical protein
MVTKVPSSYGQVREHQRPPAPSRPRGGVAREEEGTLGAVDCITFRGVVWKAALKGRSCVSAANRVSRVPRWALRSSCRKVQGRPITARSFGAFCSKWRRASVHDKGCPGRSGWGKSTLASGRRGGGYRVHPQGGPEPLA